MSDTTTPKPIDPVTVKALETKAADIATAAVDTIMSAPPGTEPSWAKPVVALGSLVLFAGMIALSVVTKNNDAMMMLVGAVITMATSASNYYLGSSAGSARKTELAAAK